MAKIKRQERRLRKEMRESFIFYKSFYESIKELDQKDQVQIYNAIFSYQFENKELELTGVCKSIFTLIIPQLEANNKRYVNGCKGGAPKGNTNASKKQPKNNQKTTKNNLNLTKKQPNDNENDNVNDNVNDNDNDISTGVDINIYDYIENNFGRTLSPVEYEEISKWEDNELTRYAIKNSVLNGKCNIKYISRILESYAKNGIKTVIQAQNEEEKFKNKKENRKEHKSFQQLEYERQMKLLWGDDYNG